MLLPAKSEAYPILLPQPPAYTPALFPSAELALQLAAPSTFVTTCEPTNQGNSSEEKAPQDSEQELQSLVALSSCNYPLINLLTAPSDGSLLGRHNISDAVKERLPLLIESGESATTSGESSAQQQSHIGAPTSPARDASTLRGSSGQVAGRDTNDNNSLRSQLPGTDTIGLTTFDWWKWVSVFAVFFMTGTLARIGILRWRRWKAQQLRQEKSVPKVLAAVPEAETSIDGRKAIIPALGGVIGASTSSQPHVEVASQQIRSPDAGGNVPDVHPITPGSLESLGQNKLPTISPGQESEDLPQRTFKKRRRKRGKGKGKGKLGYEDGESDDEVDNEHRQGSNGSPERSPRLLKNGGLQLEVDAKSLETQTLGLTTGGSTIKRKETVPRLDGLKVSDDVLGKLTLVRTMSWPLIQVLSMQDTALKGLSCLKEYFRDGP